MPKKEGRDAEGSTSTRVRQHTTRTSCWRAGVPPLPSLVHAYIQGRPKKAWESFAAIASRFAVLGLNFFWTALLEWRVEEGRKRWSRRPRPPAPVALPRYSHRSVYRQRHQFITARLKREPERMKVVSRIKRRRKCQERGGFLLALH